MQGKLTDAYSNLAMQLTTLGSEEKRLADLVEKLTMLLNERLLWTASTSPIGPAWIEQTRRAANWFQGRENWSRAVADLVGASTQAPVLSAGILLLFAALLVVRPQLRRWAGSIAERRADPNRDKYGLTLQLLVIYVLWVLPWPLLLAGAGWLLRTFHAAEYFSAAVGHGLTRLATTVFILELFRQLSQPSGLLETHFDWSSHACSVLHRNLGWIRLFIYLISLTLGTIKLQPAQLVGDSPGRIAVMFGLLGATLFLWRLLHPRRGALSTYLAAHRDGWLWRLRSIWYPVAIACPLALEALALSGYYYTATDLASRLGYSFYAALGVLLLHHLSLRWARVSEQRLERSHAMENREANQQARAAQQSGDVSGEGVPDRLELSETSIREISEQTRSLLRAAALVLLVLALWLQWADLAPAGRLLDQITLWQQSVGEEGKQRLEAVTLWALTKTVLVILLTLIAVQNLPGFLEISLLRRLSLDRGSRYAITAVSRYLFLALGVIIASNIIGFGWSKVQWLVAALTVGLGFGLQEIFANFVSGLILLFERPIRIGDTVTVGTTTGTVTRIRTRATTITDWDRKELIIPNRSFVTGDVINWTLSDPVTRLIIRVGVAYGSDVDLTERLMLEAAEAHPLVMDDPPPTVFFRGFGESSLDFELRVFYRDVLKRALLTHELNRAINSSFAANGIEIAFPQRDIHVRSFQPELSMKSERDH
ncbi:MAG: mechanosensitive ion channel [Chromatiales bacterium]